MRTVKEKIQAKIRRAPKGTLFVLSDFSDLGSYESVKKGVQTLVKEEALIPLMEGVYKKKEF